MSTFISIGNAKQSFKRFFTMIDDVAHLLPQPVFIQCGHTQYENDKFTIVEFIDMDQFATQISAAKLIILHAGAGSVIHAISAGKKPIIIPRESQFNEHVDDHQLEFSQKLEEQDKVYVARDSQGLGESIDRSLNEANDNKSEIQRPPALAIIKSVFDKYEQTVF
jgi:UDP-N-acetylglucosamine transferase subunit ALG13